MGDKWNVDGNLEMTKTTQSKQDQPLIVEEYKKHFTNSNYSITVKRKTKGKNLY